MQTEASTCFYLGNEVGKWSKLIAISTLKAFTKVKNRLNEMGFFYLIWSTNSQYKSKLRKKYLSIYQRLQCSLNWSKFLQCSMVWGFYYNKGACLSLLISDWLHLAKNKQITNKKNTYIYWRQIKVRKSRNVKEWFKEVLDPGIYIGKNNNDPFNILTCVLSYWRTKRALSVIRLSVCHKLKINNKCWYVRTGFGQLAIYDMELKLVP